MLYELARMGDEDLRLIDPNRLVHLLGQFLQNVAVLAHDLFENRDFVREGGIVGGELDPVGGVRDVEGIALLNIEMGEDVFRENDPDGASYSQYLRVF
jgi:hypothetical protein